MATTQVTTTSSTAAIHVHDFCPYTDDVLRDTWSAGKMRHVVDALAGTPVVITTNSGSGSTRIGVTLEGVTVNRSVHCVTVRDEFGVMNYRLADLGPVIIPLNAERAKWDALSAVSAEKRSAISKAQAEAGNFTDTPLRWEAMPFADGVYVLAASCLDRRKYPTTLWSVTYRLTELG